MTDEQMKADGFQKEVQATHIFPFHCTRANTAGKLGVNVKAPHSTPTDAAPTSLKSACKGTGVMLGPAITDAGFWSLERLSKFRRTLT